MQLTDEVATLGEEAAVRETQILLLKEEMQRASDGGGPTGHHDDGDRISANQLVQMVEEIRLLQMSVCTKKADSGNKVRRAFWWLFL